MFARATRRIQMRTPVSIAVHPHPHSSGLGNVDFPGDKRALKEDGVQCRIVILCLTKRIPSELTGEHIRAANNGDERCLNVKNNKPCYAYIWVPWHTSLPIPNFYALMCIIVCVHIIYYTIVNAPRIVYILSAIVVETYL